MGCCLLGCFGGSKNRKRRKQINKLLPRDKHPHGSSISHQNDAISEQKAIESSPISLVDLQDNKSEEKSSSSGSKKRVTFNSDVKTYEHVSQLYESKDFMPEITKSLTDEEIEQISARLIKNSLSEEISVASSVRSSQPPNYRYQNYRDSDDEIEEFCDDDGEDLDDDNVDDYVEDDDHAFVVGREEWSGSILTSSMESRTENLSNKKNGVEMSSVTESEVTLLQKENLIISVESEIPSSGFEPLVERLLSSNVKKPKSGRYDNISNEEVAVDASLSTWLLSSSKTNNTPLESNISSENNDSHKSQTSKYVRNLEDRPILGALTVEELKEIAKYSYSSSPRKSPCRSPDEMVIIGSVGTYWNESVVEKESLSVSSYKGIPNTNKKYSEDKKVKWHSTPFEKRLEQALNQVSGEKKS